MTLKIFYNINKEIKNMHDIIKINSSEASKINSSEASNITETNINSICPLNQNSQLTTTDSHGICLTNVQDQISEPVATTYKPRKFGSMYCLNENNIAIKDFLGKGEPCLTTHINFMQETKDSTLDSIYNQYFTQKKDLSEIELEALEEDQLNYKLESAKSSAPKILDINFMKYFAITTLFSLLAGLILAPKYFVQYLSNGKGFYHSYSYTSADPKFSYSYSYSYRPTVTSQEESEEEDYNRENTEEVSEEDYNRANTEEVSEEESQEQQLLEIFEASIKRMFDPFIELMQTLPRENNSQSTIDVQNPTLFYEQIVESDGDVHNIYLPQPKTTTQKTDTTSIEEIASVEEDCNKENPQETDTASIEEIESVEEDYNKENKELYESKESETIDTVSTGTQTKEVENVKIDTISTGTQTKEVENVKIDTVSTGTQIKEVENVKIDTVSTGTQTKEVENIKETLSDKQIEELEIKDLSAKQTETVHSVLEEEALNTDIVTQKQYKQIVKEQISGKDNANEIIESMILDILKNSESNIAILNEIAAEINESKNHISKDDQKEEADIQSIEDTEANSQIDINFQEEVS